MKKPTFFESIGITLLFSLLGTGLFYVMTVIIGAHGSIELMIATLSLCYLLYIIIRSAIKTGRITAIALWFVITLSSLALSLPLTIFFLVQISIVWLLRSLYFYSSALSSLMDLILTGFSIAIAIWASTHTGVLFLTLWCFFLVQSLFVFIPKTFRKKQQSEVFHTDINDDFEKSYKTAKQAIAKLAN